MRKILLFIFFILLSDLAVSQWSPTAGPGKAKITDIVAHNSQLYTVTDSGGVYYSSDNGDSWNDISISGETDWLVGIALIDSFIFVATGTEGIYRSSNKGVTWEHTGWVSKTYIHKIVAFDKVLYVGVGLSGKQGYPMFKSTDYGLNWMPMDIDVDAILTIVKDNQRLYVGTSNGIFYSDNDGNKWSQLKSDLIASVITLFCRDSVIVFSNISRRNMFRSTNHGASWDTVVTESSDFTNWYSSSYDSTLIVSTGLGSAARGVRLSLDLGVSWFEVNKGLPNLETNVVLATKDTLFVGHDNVIYRMPIKYFSGVSNYSVQEENIHGLSVYPMPTELKSHLVFRLNNPSNISIRVFNIIGQSVSKIGTKLYPAGENVLPLSMLNIPKGVHCIAITDGLSNKSLTIINGN